MDVFIGSIILLNLVYVGCPPQLINGGRGLKRATSEKTVALLSCSIVFNIHTPNQQRLPKERLLV